MAKRGNHYGFATARVNANVEARGIIAEALAISEEIAKGDQHVDLHLPGTTLLETQNGG